MELKIRTMPKPSYQAYLAEAVKAKLFGLVVPPIPRNTELPRKKKSSSNRKNKSTSQSFAKIHENINGLAARPSLSMADIENDEGYSPLIFSFMRQWGISAAYVK